MLEGFIGVINGRIENLEKKWQIDTIVNAARPTLMGGKNNSVDKSIHEKIDEINKAKGYLKNKILNDPKLSPQRVEKIIRCNRGDVVKTSGCGLCKTILHTVGPKYDGGKGCFNTCSKSRSDVLRSCYRKITELAFNDPEIKIVAIPVIASGNYGFNFKLAFKIGISEIYNTLLEIKRKNPESFSFTTLKKFYFVIDKTENYEVAKEILEEFRKVFKREKRVVSNGSFESQRELLQEIWLYDCEKGYFSITKWFRMLLVVVRMFLFPLNYIKDWIGNIEWEKRRNVVELGTISKVIIALGALLYYRYVDNGGTIMYVLWGLMIYNLVDTILYLLSLIIFADIQNPSANVIRSMIMLVLNYVETSIEIAVIGLVSLSGEIGVRKMLLYSFIGESLPSEIVDMAGNEIFLLFNNGIKFFFLTLVFGYFVNHLRQREFRTK